MSNILCGQAIEDLKHHFLTDISLLGHCFHACNELKYTPAPLWSAFQFKYQIEYANCEQLVTQREGHVVYNYNTG